MRVIALNGSPKEHGNTYQAIRIAADELEKESIEVEIIHVGNKLIQGCMACDTCASKKNEQCILKNDLVNEWIQKMKNADGIILGSPVHYAAISGTMKSFLDRAFYVSSVNGSMFRHKVGAAIVADRRAGGTHVFNQLNNYLTYSEMILATSNYWNVAYGTVPGEVKKDEEGMQIMRLLGQNMAWLMKVIEAGKPFVKENPKEEKIFTNFIR